MVDDDPADEDVDFEVELDVVDVASVALALLVVSSGFNALVSGSILMATAPILWVLLTFFNLRCLVLEGAYDVSTDHEE